MTADRIIEVLFVANLAGSIAILAVLALRGVVRRLAGARIAYLAWLIVPAVILAVFLPARTTELPLAQIPVGAAIDPAPAMDSFAVKEPLAAANIAEAARIPMSATTVNIDWTLLLALVWAAGVLAALIFLTVRQLLAVRALGPLTHVSPTTSRAARSAIGPAVVGIFSPRIVLPANFEESFDDTERKVVIAHEEAHLRGRHTAVKTIVEIAVCLSWFNPLAYLAARSIAMDQELACDEAVAARYPHDRKAYAGALLKTQAGPRLPLGCYWPAQSARNLKARIRRLGLAAPSRTRRIAGVSALALLAIAAGCTTWAARPAETRIVESAAKQDALRLLAPPSVEMPRYWTINFNADDPVILRGKVIRFERNYDLMDGTLLAAVWIEADRITAVGGDWQAPYSRTKIWRVTAGSPNRWPDWVDARIVGQEVIARGYRSFDKTCQPACLASSPDWTFPGLPTLQPFADVTWTRDRDASADQPLRIVAVRRALLEVHSANGDKYVHRFLEPGESYSPRVGYGWTVSTDDGSAFEWRLGDRPLGLLAPAGGPVQKQSVDLVLINVQEAARAPAIYSAPDDQPAPAPQNPPTPTRAEFDPNDTIYLRGKIEKIEFGDTTYVAFVRAENFAADPYKLAQINTQLWALSPTNYFGDPDNRKSITATLTNKNVDVFGYNAKDKSCVPTCRLHTRELIMRPANTLYEAGFAGLPGRIVLDAITDVSTHVQLKGRVLRFDNAEESATPQGVLWVEAESVEPATTPGAAAGTMWRVVGIPGSVIQSRFWQGAQVTVNGVNVKDKSCQPACLMVGTQIY